MADWYGMAKERKRTPQAQKPQPATGTNWFQMAQEWKQKTPQEKPLVGPERIGAAIEAIDPALKDEGRQFDYPGADIMTHRAAGTVDDPEAKMRVYAEARFPDLSPEERIARYGIDDEGEIFYLTDDGQQRYEAPASLRGRLGRFSGEMLAAGPEIGAAIAASGLTGGAILPVMAASMGGEAIRKAEGALRGDDQDAWDWFGDLGVAGLLAGAAEGAGKLVKGVGNRIASRGSRAERVPYLEIANKPLTRSEIQMAEELGKIADEAGIPLAGGQKFNRKSLIDRYKLLRDDPRTADYVMEYERNQAEKVEQALGRKVDDLIKPDDTPDVIARDLNEASKGVFESARAERTAKVKPFYDRAFQNVDRSKLDVQPVLDQFDEAMKEFSETSPSRRKLLNVKRLLQKKTTDPNGETVWVPNDDLKQLDNAKKQIDNMTKAHAYDPTRFSPGEVSVLTGKMTDLKRQLLKITDEASPDYAIARAEYAKASQPIEGLKQSIIGEIAGLKKDGTINTALNKLLSGRATAKQIERVKPLLEKKDPGILKRAVGGYIRDVQNHLTETETGDLVNLAGKMHKRVFGSQEKRDVLKAALEPQEYENLSKLFRVFEAVAKTSGKESTTASRQVMTRELDSALGSRILTAGAEATDPANWTKVVSRAFSQMNKALEKDARGVFEAMTTPEVTEIVKKMSPLSRNTQRNVRLLTAAMAMIGAEAGLNEGEREFSTDFAPRQPQARAQSTQGRNLTPLENRIR